MSNYDYMTETSTAIYRGLEGTGLASYQISHLWDPCDVGYYGPVAEVGTAQAGFPRTVWGSWGDSPWPQAVRAALLREHLDMLRSKGWIALAGAVERYAASGSVQDHRTASLAAVAVARAVKAHNRNAFWGGATELPSA